MDLGYGPDSTVLCVATFVLADGAHVVILDGTVCTDGVGVFVEMTV